MEGSKRTQEVADFDDLLPHVGEFGIYQKLLFLMMIPFTFAVACVYFVQIFITLVPEKHWCRIPELDHLPLEQRLQLGIPLKDDGSGYDQCSMYVANWTEVLASGVLTPDATWPKTRCQNGWEYDPQEMAYETISTELEWVCEKAALPTVAQSLFFVGAIAGGLIWGWVADRWGRIPALIGSNLIGFLGGVCTAFASSFWIFAFCRFTVGLAFDNCFTMMYILVLEYVGPKWRTFVANMSIALFFTLAACLIPWVSLWVADWRWICVVTSLPLLAFVITPYLVPESARWLVSQGKTEKAIQIMKKFEKINKTKVDPKIYTEFAAACEKTVAEEKQETYSVLDLFKTPRLRKITILLIIIWMAVSLVFDGHVRSVRTLGLDVFLTFTITSATELPADTLLTLTLDRWGRRWLACLSMLLAGVFSWATIVLPLGAYSAAMAILGRCAVNISYNIGLQYAAEVLPTVVRAQGVALIHIMGYTANFVSPFVIYLETVDRNLPFLVLGCIGVIGGLLSLFLPETMDRELPQTLRDGEEFGKNDSLFDFPCVRKTEDNVENGETFRRSVSLRASIRGETLRSSMINRRSVRSTK
ncbi:carcinine transporter [Halyomorpha halys]|uniref:carcinine transporter n=1 Tax=Halyomorpha halys TaxID=286706 RepID=UPI0006D52986|nr:carcinine transporter [Halyomorpha halys]